MIYGVDCIAVLSTSSPPPHLDVCERGGRISSMSDRHYGGYLAIRVVAFRCAGSVFIVRSSRVLAFGDLRNQRSIVVRSNCADRLQAATRLGLGA
jgi:hypothetical protein